MAQKGMAGEAIGIVTVVSFIGGFIGIAALALFAPLLADFAISFQPRDDMFLALLGIFLVSSLSGESLAKDVFAGALGIGLGAVGMDPLTFTVRFTFGTDALRAGVSFVAVMIGMFGISEGLMPLHTINTPGHQAKDRANRAVPGFGAQASAFGAANLD